MKAEILKAILNNVADDAHIKIRTLVASGSTETELSVDDITIGVSGISFVVDISCFTDFIDEEDDETEVI